MSEPRHNWWPFALNMIRDYPSWREKYQGQKLTAAQKRTQEFREYKAVREAVELTSILPEGKTRLQIVSLTEWRRSDHLDTAAEKSSVSYRTARRYRWNFILLTGYKYGLISQEEYYREITKEQAGRANREQ